MPRAPRMQLQSGWHHVTNRGLDRRDVFRSTDDRVDFGRMIAAGHDDLGVTVMAYCLMTNHYHLVLSCPEGSLSPFMQQLGAKFTRHTNERHGGDGPVFRGRFASRPIRSERYLLNAVRYVHRNPLDIRPAVDLADYRWSSHRTYLGLRPAPAWLSLTPVLDWFDTPNDFDAVVRSDQQVRESITTTVDDLCSALALTIDVLGPDLDRAPQGLVRTVAYLVIDRVDPNTRTALIERLAPSSPDALQQAVWRSQRRARSEPWLLRAADEALALLSSCV